MGSCCGPDAGRLNEIFVAGLRKLQGRNLFLEISRFIARPLRLEFSESVSPVTSWGNARQDIVRDDRGRTQCLTLLAHVVDR